MITRYGQRFFLPIIATILIGAAALYLLLIVPGVVSGTIALLALVALIAWKPRWGLYAMCLAMPVIGWEFSILGLYFTLIDLVALAMVLGLGVRYVVTRLFGKRPQVLRLPLAGLFAAFFASILLSNLFSGDPLPALWYAARVIVMFYAAYVVVPASLLDRPKFLRIAVSCVAVSGLIVAGSSVVTLIGQYLDADFFRVRGVRIFGIYPFGVNHNLVAEYLIMTNFFLLALRYWFRSPAARRFLNLSFIILTVVALATFSRAAWIATFLQLLAFFVLRKTDKLKLAMSSIALVLLLMPLAFKMVQLQENNFSATASRLQLTKIAWQSFLDRPVLGFGTGNFMKLVGDNIRFTAQYGDPMDSHGILQKVMAEQGTLGLIVFLLIAAAIFRRLFSLYDRSAEFQELLLPLTVGCLGTFIFQFFNTSYYKGKLWLPIGIALAAAALMQNPDKKHLLYVPPKN